MKKAAVLLMSLILIFGLTACGNKQQADNPTEPSSEKENEINSEQEDSETETTESTVPEEPAETETTESTVPEEPAETEAADTQGGKTLVVYYSATGNTGEAADYIAAATDGVLFELEPKEPYSDADLNWGDDSSRVVREHENPDERNVELVTTEVSDWESYDIVFVGYPIWWGIAAWPVDTFIKANDFTGKTVIPFCTSSSSGLGESGELLEEMAGTGEWLEGKRFSSGVSEEDVRTWVESLRL